MTRSDRGSQTSNAPFEGLLARFRATIASPAADLAFCSGSGFRGRAALDESPETLKKVRQAVACAKEGDRDALRFLYVVYCHLQTIVKYDDRGIPFFAWLLRLARSVAIDHLRVNRPTPTETVIDPEMSSGVDLDRAGIVRCALATLPDEQRQVAILRHVVGLTPGEIADRLGRTEGSIHGLHIAAGAPCRRSAGTGAS